MANHSIPSAFFKGLKEQHHNPTTQSNFTIDNITQLRCLRWIMKHNDISIEIKRANILASTQMSLQLVKYDENGNIVNTGVDISVTDNRIEKGLFELEYKTMQHANLKSNNGLETVLEWLRANKISLPAHDDLRTEIIMKGHTMRIGYLGIDPTIGEDLFGGCLLLDNKVVLSIEPQTRTRYVLDKLEDALHAKRRGDIRGSIGELMFKLRKESPNTDAS